MQNRGKMPSFIGNNINILTKHLDHPDISIAQYSKAKRLELGQEVLKKKRIYLDQKYWNYCRDAKRGKPQKPIHEEIWKMLCKNVQIGKMICPVAFPILDETFKQKDVCSRKVTGEVIDELSKNVVILPPLELFKLEFLYFIRKHTSKKDLYSCASMAFTYIPFLCGEQIPYNKAFDNTTMTAIQKSIFDIFSEIPFSYMTDGLNDVDFNISHDDSDFQRKQTIECQKHQHEFKTFHDVFMSEIAGILDVMEDKLSECLQYFFESETGIKNPTYTEDEIRKTKKMYANLIYHAFASNKISTELPELHIQAGLHAITRYQERAFKKGDLHDYMHARVALPYCNIFLTEKSLGNLLTKPPLEYDKQYSCQVLWKDEEILEVLQKL